MRTPMGARLNMAPELAIVIVSWNVRDLLRRCLQAVEVSLRGSEIPYETIVVDNASSDATPAMLRAEFPHVRLIESGGNLGFSGGNNVALRALLSTQSSALKYVLLLNPDTEPLPGAIPALVRYLERRPDLVAVGPQLRYPDGSVQSSRRRFPTRAAFFWESTPLERLWPANPWARRFRLEDVPHSVEQRVGWLVGAALLVRADAIARAGLLDEGFFMYSEELEWQCRMQNAECRIEKAALGAQHSFLNAQCSMLNSKIAYLPEAVITHHEGQSSAQVPAGRHLYFQRSKLRLARMLYGPRFAALLRLFLLLCYGWELAVESAKWLLGHRRDLRASRINAYLTVLKSLAIARRQGEGVSG
jgi:N-acetylglucosaminyl-diphospho-decaprenol L-rhamnosyltransferase